MLSCLKSAAIVGIDAWIVDVEVDISTGFPAFDIVGLGDSAVKESKERVRTAIKNSGYVLPSKRITVNLAPAHLRKEGPAFDFAIAMGLLMGCEMLHPYSFNHVLFMGELSLNGNIKPVRGVLSAAQAAKSKGFTSIVVAWENAKEASLVKGLKVIAARSLNEFISILKKEKNVEPIDEITFCTENEFFEDDYRDIKGQTAVVRCMEIAASGKHNLLLLGPPGTGKTMMLKRLPTILPPLEMEEALELTRIYSVAKRLDDQILIKKRPFRSPHHSISYAALSGGGRLPVPGEITLSHHGVLFLDELPEFQRHVIENLRQPMEEKKIHISRVGGSFSYPADFMLVASMNPCPCGYLGDDRCKCTQKEIVRYTGKISGPLLDRIDIHIKAPSLTYQEISSQTENESSTIIRQRVKRTRNIQKLRFKEEKITYNGQMTAAMIEKYCVIGEKEKKFLEKGFETFALSARAYHKILKLARTIADMECADQIEIKHLAESLAYRSLDKKFYR